MRYAILVGSLGLIVSCGTQGQSTAPTTAPTAPELSEAHAPAPDASYAALKAWFAKLPTTHGQVQVSTAQQMIDQGKNKNWKASLGITGNTHVVVNASNETISFGGRGLNGALVAYVKAKEADTHQGGWYELKHSDGKSPTRYVPAGQFAISDVSFGHIYHAVGPKASNVGQGDIPTLAAAQERVQKLYYDMLSRAVQQQMTTIVLPAISTAIFAAAGTAQDGKKFTEKEFIAAMYQGMYAGIQQFLEANPTHRLRIVLNYWALPY